MALIKVRESDGFNFLRNRFNEVITSLTSMSVDGDVFSTIPSPLRSIAGDATGRFRQEFVGVDSTTTPLFTALSQNGPKFMADFSGGYFGVDTSVMNIALGNNPVGRARLMVVGPDGFYRSVGVNQPAFEWNPITLQPRGLLMLGNDRGDASRYGNQITFSNSPSTSVWSFVGSSLTQNTTETRSPENLLNSHKMAEDTTSGMHYTRVAYTSLNQGALFGQSISIHVKPFGGRTTCALAWADTAVTTLSSVNSATNQAYAFFNLTGNGSVGTVGGTFLANLRRLRNGWWRISLTKTSDANLTSGALYLIGTTGTTVGTEIYTGSATSGLYFYGAQSLFTTNGGGSTSENWRMPYIPTYGQVGTQISVVESQVLNCPNALKIFDPSDTTSGWSMFFEFSEDSAFTGPGRYRSQTAILNMRSTTAAGGISIRGLDGGNNTPQAFNLSGNTNLTFPAVISHKFAVSYNPVTMTSIVSRGGQSASGTAINNLPAVPVDFAVGARQAAFTGNAGGFAPLDAGLLRFYVWNRALSSAELNAITS